MLQSGVELLTALNIARSVLGNVVLEEIVQSASDGVREGKSLATELDRGHLFPRILIHMTAVGERTGQLEHMLLRVSEALESEVNAVIGSLTSILEPLLILFIAVIVGGIMASVMMPMTEMTALLGKGLS
jgi:type II secretory pathway component PulF